MARRAALHRARETTAPDAAPGDRMQGRGGGGAEEAVWKPPQAAFHNTQSAFHKSHCALRIPHSPLRIPHSSWLELLSALPEHLGWGSAAQTAVLRAAARRDSAGQDDDDRAWIADLRPQRARDKTAELATPPATVALPPALGLAILKQKEAAAGRLWLLLRALDGQGRGWVEAAVARVTFCGEDSAWRFCSARRLRGLLAGGDGRFWELANGRIWLRSMARVARMLGLRRLDGRTVALPTPDLLGGIAAVRAQLYAAFHSGRRAGPIARQTIARRSGVAPRTQRRYDRLSGVERKANFACGPRLDSEAAQEAAWRRGPAAFVCRERRRGREGRFLAWQLPNSYHGPHARMGRGRQKRHQKALADLLTQGTAGNGQALHGDLSQRYFAHARCAAAALGRATQAIYWPAAGGRFWHWLPAPAELPQRNGPLVKE